MQWPLEEWALDGLSVDAQGTRDTPVPRGLAQAHALGTSSLTTPLGRPGRPTAWALLWAEAPGSRACGGWWGVQLGSGEAGGQPGRAEDVDGSAPHAGLTLVQEMEEDVWKCCGRRSRATQKQGSARGQQLPAGQGCGVGGRRAVTCTAQHLGVWARLLHTQTFSRKAQCASRVGSNILIVHVNPIPVRPESREGLSVRLCSASAWLAHSTSFSACKFLVSSWPRCSSVL